MAERLPHAGKLGSVIAVFRRSCWLETPGSRLFCVADNPLGEGPLTLGVELPPRYNMDSLGIREGTFLVTDGEDFRFGRQMVLRTNGATVWRPPPIGHTASVEVIRRRLEGLITGMETYAPRDGLAPLVVHVAELAQGRLPDTASIGPIARGPMARSPVARLAMPHVAQLSDGIFDADRRQVDQAVEGLVGLGPGLTPSGDDFLGGLMVALSAALEGVALDDSEIPGCHPWQNTAPSVAALAESVTGHSFTKTTRISAALLEQSARGIGSAAQHHLLRCLLETEDSPSLNSVAFAMTRLGHTSGWDTLAGTLLGVGLGLRFHGATPGITSSLRELNALKPRASEVSA